MSAIYPYNSPEGFNISQTIEVNAGEVVRLAFFNVPTGYKWLLEQRFSNGSHCGDDLGWLPVDGPCCAPLEICDNAATFDLAVPGIYRLFAKKVDGSPVLKIDLDAASILTREIPDPNGVLAAKILSEVSTMSCGDSFIITETPNDIVIVKNGSTYTIPKFRDCSGVALIGGTKLPDCDSIPDTLCVQMASLPISSTMIGG